MSFLLWVSLLFVVLALLLIVLCIKYPMLRSILYLLFTRHTKGTFSHWRFYKWRYMKLQAKAKLTDKLFAKQYVEQIYTDTMDIKCAKLLFEGVPTIKDFKKLKQVHKQFVIKANHGCGWNNVVRKDTHLSEKDIIASIKQCSSWLNMTYGNTALWKLFRCRELQYQYIEPKIFIEEHLGENMKDYKLHAINGKVEFVEVIFDRGEAGKSGQHHFNANLYSVAPWRLLEGVSTDLLLLNDPKTKIEEPQQMEAMVEFAETFTKTSNFEYCRVDLYVIRNEIYFGEFTFSPAGCMGRYYPLSFDQYLLQQLQEQKKDK